MQFRLERLILFDELHEKLLNTEAQLASRGTVQPPQPARKFLPLKIVSMTVAYFTTQNSIVMSKHEPYPYRLISKCIGVYLY